MSGPLFVVGCPRSGTSLFARWLDACGLTSASDDRRREGYPSGFFEHMPMLMFHKAIERLSRGADHAIKLEPFLRSELLQDPFIKETFALAFAPALRGEVDFVKFPQLALSIDFLLEQFPGARVLALWRDPVTSFRSLVRREFPREMLPAAGIKAILLWDLYAYHIERASQTYPRDVTVVHVDAFLRDPTAGTGLLARLGLDPSRAHPVEEIADLSSWRRPVPLPWRAYHAAMRWTCRLLESRLGPERGVLADQGRWVRALADVSTPGGDGAARSRAGFARGEQA